MAQERKYNIPTRDQVLSELRTKLEGVPASTLSDREKNPFYAQLQDLRDCLLKAPRMKERIKEKGERYVVKELAKNIRKIMKENRGGEASAASNPALFEIVASIHTSTYSLVNNMDLFINYANLLKRIERKEEVKAAIERAIKGITLQRNYLMTAEHAFPENKINTHALSQMKQKVGMKDEVRKLEKETREYWREWDAALSTPSKEREDVSSREREGSTSPELKEIAERAQSVPPKEMPERSGGRPLRRSHSAGELEQKRAAERRFREGLLLRSGLGVIAEEKDRLARRQPSPLPPARRGSQHTGHADPSLLSQRPPRAPSQSGGGRGSS